MIKLVLGVELGSTRIKSVLIDERGATLASGSFEWENEYVGGHWSYSLQKVKEGLQASYAGLVKNFGRPIERLDAIGISGMMHGYLAFDKDWNLLEPFRTWRDTTTSQAAEILSQKLQFNMPQRWSATHYYQAVLNKEKTVEKVAHLQTLSGYVHFLLTGQNVVGANDASGMFPIKDGGWDSARAEIYNKFVPADIQSLLPKVLLAGQFAGLLTEEGARYLDPTGTLKSGAPLCPPEGDMGTGMICTNAVRPTSAQVSCGTSANMSVVLERPLKNYYSQIDIISTPDGFPAALIHTNNCTSEINEWVNLFSEVAALCGAKIPREKLIEKLFLASEASDKEVGKLTGYNFLAGEPLAKTAKGAPLVLRDCDGKLNLANFMQMQIYSALAALSLGTDILQGEGVKITSVTAHGGFYKTDKIGQIATAAALNAPVTVKTTAGEGGAYGIALLAAYMLKKDVPLREFLDEIFKGDGGTTLTADPAVREKYNTFFKNYKKYLATEQLAARAD